MIYFNFYIFNVYYYYVFNITYINLNTFIYDLIQEINKLAYKGDRNIQLLNFFFQNIIEYHNILSAGACSNLMFNMNKLSYSDEVRI